MIRFNRYSGLDVLEAKIKRKRHLNKTIFCIDCSRNDIFCMCDIFSPYFSTLMGLNLSNSKIEIIHKGTFENLRQLRALDLRKNHLTFLPPMLFEQNRNLSVLNLSQNRLTTVNNTLFASIGQLRRLYLNANQLKHFSLITLANLTELTLNQNRLSFFERNQMPKLDTLNLSDNCLNEINESMFENMPSLEILHLQSNIISRVHEQAFRYQTKLTQLLLTNNLIAEFGENLFATSKSLVKICLGRNRLQTFANHSFRDLLLLEELALDSNQLSKIASEWFVDLISLRILSMSSNRIEQIENDSFANLSRLEHVYLKSNEPRGDSGLEIGSGLFRKTSQLREILMQWAGIRRIHEQAFSMLSQLHYLDLSGNKLNELPRYFLPQRSFAIGILDLSNNPIRDLSSLRQQSELIGCTQCTIVYLKLQKLPLLPLNNDFLAGVSVYDLNLSESFAPDRPLNFDFGQIDGLRALDLNRNGTRGFPVDFFSKLTKLRTLDLTGNDFRQFTMTSASCRRPVQNVCGDLFTRNSFLTVPLFRPDNVLVMLWLSRCKIQFVAAAALKNLSSLETLDLSFNQMRLLDRDLFRDLVSVQVICLNDNKLIDFDENPFKYNLNLRSLNIHNNEITRRTLHFFDRLESLEEIWHD